MPSRISEVHEAARALGLPPSAQGQWETQGEEQFTRAMVDALGNFLLYLRTLAGTTECLSTFLLSYKLTNQLLDDLRPSVDDLTVLISAQVVQCTALLSLHSITSSPQLRMIKDALLIYFRVAAV